MVRDPARAASSRRMTMPLVPATAATIRRRAAAATAVLSTPSGGCGPGPRAQPTQHHHGGEAGWAAPAGEGGSASRWARVGGRR